MKNNEITLNKDGTPKIILGRTMVECYRLDEKLEKEVSIKQGVVTADYGSFLRVWDTRPVSKGGDSNSIGECFPMAGKRSYTRIVGELEERNSIRVPVSF